MTSGAQSEGSAAGASPRATPAGGPDEVADAVRAAALATEGVADVHASPFGEVATYLPGRKVEGVRLRDEAVEVHLVTTWPAPVLQVADRVRRSVRRVPGLADARVDVVVDDVATPEDGTSADGSHAS